MLPLNDDLVSRSAPVMTVSIVTLNVLVFLYQMSLQLGISLEVDNPPHALETAQAFVLEFGLIPCRLMDLCAYPEDQPAPLFTIVSSMFLHAGFLHVGGNMLYLWIFGKNVEDTLGHTRFTLFYLLSGVAAALTQVLASPASEVPMIGASGAVSGVLGAYLILFPQSRVLTLVIFGFFWRLVRIPAVIVLGFWIVLQILNGLGSFGDAETVAWFAHIGGFFAGMLLLIVMRPRTLARR
jgi:membrane associated rhomboid family serine protease